jgi:hypothetical protein
MSTENTTLAEQVQRMEEKLDLLINNLAKNNRSYLNALKEIAQSRMASAKSAVAAIESAEGNICPECPPGCEADCEEGVNSKNLEERLNLLINNLAKNNRSYLDALREIAQSRMASAEAGVAAVETARGNVCPEYPPGCPEPDDEK